MFSPTVDTMHTENQSLRSRFGRRLWIAAVFIVRFMIYLMAVFGGLHTIHVRLNNNTVEETMNEGDVFEVILVKKKVE